MRPIVFMEKLVDHPKYGRQLKVERYEQEKPTTANGIVAYLSSEKFPGIGKKTAEKIVELLGEDAIEKIIADPSVLKQVSGLTKPKREMLAENDSSKSRDGSSNHGIESLWIR